MPFKCSCDLKGFDVLGEVPLMSSGQSPGNVQDGPHRSHGLCPWQESSAGCGWVLSNVGTRIEWWR